MTDLLTFTIVGVVIGSAYAIAASGLVITYATSNIFNMAHGAVAMVMAFLYWELAENQGLHPLLTLVLVVGVAAPLLGALVERTMMRRLADASVTVTLTVTVGLLVLLVGIAQNIWPPRARTVTPFFAGRSVELGEVVVSGHEITILVLAILVAGGLYYLLNRTRTGIGMRAIVDDRPLIALQGARPQFLSQLSWALGFSLAALAGILLVNELGLTYIELTLLVVNSYAAAMVGRLKNLPRTILGAMILGLMQSYFFVVMRWLPREFTDAYSGVIGGFRASLPTILLFAVMLLLPHARLRAGRVAGATLVRAPSWRAASLSGIGLVVGVAVLTGFLPTSAVAQVGQGLAFALIMLSLVVLTGYGGDVSLGQMAFVGIGALVVARYFGTVTFGAIVAATLIAAIVGALVAIPTLRLRGLYLGLGTLAFALLVDKMVFESAELGFGLGGSAIIDRPQILGMSFASERAFTVLVATAFVLMAFVVLAIRKGRFGRLALATRDSPAACGTLGLNITMTRVALFAVSAGMAGLAGAIFSGMTVVVGPANFMWFQSLLLLLLAVIGGVTSVTGALIGGAALAFLGVLPGAFVFVLIGLGAVSLGRYPNGLAGFLFALSIRRRSGEPTAGAPVVDPDLAVSEEVSPVASH